jgi:hypothetical protein
MKKDGMVSIIVEKIKQDKGLDRAKRDLDTDELENDYSDEMGLETAAESIIAAVNDESPSDLISALKDFIDMCKTNDSKSE